VNNIHDGSPPIALAPDQEGEVLLL